MLELNKNDPIKNDIAKIDVKITDIIIITNNLNLSYEEFYLNNFF